MCAIEAGKRGRRVAVLDHADRIGKKILISGGGRCNFTNIHCRPENFISKNPHFCKSALARYTPADFIKLVEKHQIAYHEKTLGQLFCDRTAQDILGMLEEECRRVGVRILPQTKVTEITRADKFVLRTKDDEFHAAALIVATGGLSIPKMGATAFGYEVAKKFGIGIVETRPALVPLTFAAEDAKRYKDLAGVSAEVVASVITAPPSRFSEKGRAHRFGHPQFREKMLFTHRGLSGPAILQISSYWTKGDAIVMDLAPSRDVMGAMLLSSAGRDLAAAKVALHQVLSTRFAERWLEHHAPAKWTNQGIEELERAVHGWEVVPEGSEGYEKAEVTAGGVDTDELSSKTMESKKVPGLYFIGEVVDVTGHLGGFNFQWAWASGFCAGRRSEPAAFLIFCWCSSTKEIPHLPPILNAQKLSKSYGADPLFQNVSFTVKEGDRVGLIGPNGSGKSTLMRVLAGSVNPDGGEVVLRKHTRLSYVEQESRFAAGETVRSVIARALEQANVIEADREARLQETLGRTGFADFNLEANALSGGWQKRLAIAEALVQHPDILLLDEPTNHLDLAGIEWLESLLETALFACVVVSHDRYFLENVATSMAELNRVYPDGILRVDGNYSKFLEKKEEFLHAQAQRQEALENRVHTEIEWLRRGAKARTSKSKARIDKAQELIGELADLNARPRTATAQIDFSAPSGRPSG